MGMMQSESRYCVPLDTVRLKRLYDSGAFCDLVLESGDGVRFPCHRVVLCLGSTFFESLLGPAGQAMREGASGEVLLPELTGATLSAALHVLYGQECVVDWEALPRLMSAAGFLGMDALRDACLRFASTHLSVHSAGTALCVAAVNDCRDLYTEAVSVCGVWCGDVEGG